MCERMAYSTKTETRFHPAITMADANSEPYLITQPTTVGDTVLQIRPSVRVPALRSKKTTSNQKQILTNLSKILKNKKQPSMDKIQSSGMQFFP